MNLSKMSMSVLTGGIILIVGISLALSYSHQSKAQSQLNQELSQAQLILSKSPPDEISSQKDELETRLAESRAHLDALKTSISPVVESIESSDCIFDIAEKCGVEVIGTRSNPPDTQELHGINYYITWIKVTVTGDVDNINRFIESWTEENRTGIVKSVRITAPYQDESEAEDTGDEDEDEDTGDEDEDEDTGDEDEDEDTGDEDEDEDTGDEDEDEDTLHEKPSANIELVIYTCEGD